MSERTRLGWEGRQRGGRLGNRFFVVLAGSRLGRAISPFFLFWVALYFLVAAPKPRRVSFDLARRVGRGGTWPARLCFAYRHFFAYGWILFDRMAILAGGEDLFRFERHGEERIVAALESGRGALLLTSHLGNWELMAQCLSGLRARTTLVMYDGVQASVKEALRELAARRSFDVLFTDGGPAAAAGILAALERGHLVGMMADRTFAGRGVDVPFLGGVIELPVGPYVIGAAARAPAFQVFAIRQGRDRYAFHGIPLGTLEYTDRRKKDEDLLRWARSFAERLEDFTRRHPEQWGNFYDFWKVKT